MLGVTSQLHHVAFNKPEISEIFNKLPDGNNDQNQREPILNIG